METIAVKGVVISSMPIGEYDRRLEILTADLGRISVFARGARKPSSSFVACTRTFAFGCFHLFQGRSSYTLSSANIDDYFTSLSEDFETSCYASYFMELAKYFSQEGLEAHEMLELVYVSFKALADNRFSNRLVKAVYELKMIELNGIYDRPDKRYLSEACAYTFDFVEKTPVTKLYTFKLTEEVETEFERTTSKMISKLTDRPFKSLAMLDLF